MYTLSWGYIRTITSLRMLDVLNKICTDLKTTNITQFNCFDHAKNKTKH